MGEVDASFRPIDRATGWLVRLEGRGAEVSGTLGFIGGRSRWKSRVQGYLEGHSATTGVER